MTEDRQIFTDVRVVHLAVDGWRVTVDFIGQTGLGSVVFHCDSEERLQAVVETVKWWQEQATPLTYLLRDGRAALLDDAALFAAGMSD